MFNLEFIWESIKAFNVNAFSSLAYIFMTNGWFFPIAISAGLSIFMLLKDEIDTDVKDEQQVL